MDQAIMVRDLPLDERPREKLIACGAGALSNAELLAILLRTGTREESVLRLAERILSRYKERGLSSITQMSVMELSEIPGLGPAKAATILAAVELGKRLAIAGSKVETVATPAEAARYMKPYFFHEMKEHFGVLFLNQRHGVIAFKLIATGSLSKVTAHPRDVFGEAIRQSAALIVLAHNHPSGNPSPSKDDIALTKRMKEAGKIMGITVSDHIIIGDYSYYSFKEHGFMA